MKFELKDNPPVEKRQRTSRCIPRSNARTRQISKTQISTQSPVKLEKSKNDPVIVDSIIVPEEIVKSEEIKLEDFDNVGLFLFSYCYFSQLARNSL